MKDRIKHNKPLKADRATHGAAWWTSYDPLFVFNRFRDIGRALRQSRNDDEMDSRLRGNDKRGTSVR